MQRYTEIPSSTSLEDSLPLILNNDKSAISCHAGTAFPHDNLQEGMLCFRTDHKKLYQLSDALTNQWRVVADLTGNARNLDGGFGTTIDYSQKDLDSWDSMPTGFYQGRNMGNMPPGDIEWRVMQIRGSGSSGYASQMAFGVNSGKTYSRFQRAGSWSTWNEMFAADTSGGDSGGNDGGSNSGMNADMVDGHHAGHGYDNVPVSDGVLNTNLNADKLDGYDAGNSTGQVPISNGTVNVNLNADKLDGRDAGNSSDQVPVSNGKLNTNLNAEMVGGVKVENLLQIDGLGNVNKQIQEMNVDVLNVRRVRADEFSAREYTASKQGERTVVVSGVKGVIDSTSASGSGNISSTTHIFATNPGIQQGSYGLFTLLQKLVDMSHTHSTHKGTTSKNCNCKCDCSDCQNCNDSDSG